MTTPDQSKGGRSRDEVLAGEYVLGVLSLEDRQKVEKRMRSDRQFAAIVTRWEQNLSGFNEEYESIVPSAAVFPKIEQRIFGEYRAGGNLWNSLLLWRVVALASLVFAAGVVIFNANLIKPQQGGKPLVAALSAQNSAIALMASYNAQSGKLRVTPVASGQPEEKSLELWLIKGSDPAIALGVLPQTGEGELAIPQNIRGQISEGDVLAVSIEPFGGSPTGKPTGDVVASGTARIP
ncbi:anti-sigma factor [Neorhizobium sp. P12A]|jgi:anti-sigma-K factor RskA|uniref:anti-sigma factor n=1 Tax=Rhizobium/Agrobacterium group TaxID=227290 RepID=UPI00104DB736|nr:MULTISPECIES: anti-sigma factor [Rhizobium/Agrobacterium group]KAA0699348.1 anti-sigma factor [Neorhizobium sp. P12A]TCR90912.1 anti-sigma-K factor RskA [Rhizobium sp. BK376]